MSEPASTKEKSAEAQPQIWVYDPERLFSGLRFAEVSLALADPDALTKKEQRQLGRTFASPNLATNSGLEHPVLIYIDGKELPFVPGIKFMGATPGEPIDAVTLAQKQREVRGKRELPEHLQGRGFEIWALKRYPTPEDKLLYRFGDRSSPLFDPAAKPEELAWNVAGVYKAFAEYDQDLLGRKPIVLGWYTSDDKFRLAIRPYKLSLETGTETGSPTLTQRGLTIATTLPRELYQPAIAR
ncbi:MAG: hypothetical protein HYT72_04200 [Candidatus Aenigmarchaeota archaeon]|nr:hypothetical protein [Candidatus Aenigmarchaeota archaeon]